MDPYTGVRYKFGNFSESISLLLVLSGVLDPVSIAPIILYLELLLLLSNEPERIPASEKFPYDAVSDPLILGKIKFFDFLPLPYPVGYIFSAN